jgi:hypothetical protein
MCITEPNNFIQASPDYELLGKVTVMLTLDPCPLSMYLIILSHTDIGTIRCTGPGGGLLFLEPVIKEWFPNVAGRGQFSRKVEAGNSRLEGL